MRSPLAQTARSAVIPAPVGGWNARDALPALESTDAVILENMIPGPGGVSLRGGSTTYATGLGAQVNSLLRFNAPGQSPRLFAGAGTKLFDVTAVGPVGAAVLSGQIGDKWQSCMFGTPGGSYLMAANGLDPPQKFDGTTWSAIALIMPQPASYTPSGGGAAVPYAYPYTLVPSKLKAPVVFGQRVWFVETGTLHVWFLPINAIGSSAQNPPATGSIVPDISPCAQCLDFSSRCRLGGSLVAMVSWTLTGATGPSDYAAFITSAGEVLVYQGTDPTIAGAWQIVGVFRISPPIGDRPVLPFGADVAVLTETGLITLSSVMPLAEGQDAQDAITDKIRGAVQSAYQSTPAVFGWAVAEYPMGALLLINVPQPDGTFQQFVMNYLTKAWCKFLGLPAVCWGLIGDRPMFGTPDGRVCQYDVQNSDNGAPINGTVLPAFSAFRTLNRKRFTLARPLYNSALGYRAPVKLKVDYDISREVLAQPPIVPVGTPWGSPWGAPWAPRVGPVASWQGVRGDGEVATVLVSVSSTNPFRLDKIDLQYETSGDLL